MIICLASSASKNTRHIKTKHTSLGMYQINGFVQFFPLIYDSSSAVRSSYYRGGACSMNRRIYCMDGTRIPGTHDSHPRQRDLCFFLNSFSRGCARLFFQRIPKMFTLWCCEVSRCLNSDLCLLWFWSNWVDIHLHRLFLHILYNYGTYVFSHIIIIFS